jgi:Site-specific recombinases, DNA invertase Pin homologs
MRQISWNMWMTVSAVLILNGRDFNSCRMTWKAEKSAV